MSLFSNPYERNATRAIALAMNFRKSDPMEWEIVDKDTLILKRKKVGSTGKKSNNGYIFSKGGSRLAPPHVQPSHSYSNYCC